MSQKICPGCQNAVDAKATSCPYCFYTFEMPKQESKPAPQESKPVPQESKPAPKEQQPAVNIDNNLKKDNISTNSTAAPTKTETAAAGNTASVSVPPKTPAPAATPTPAAKPAATPASGAKPATNGTGKKDEKSKKKKKFKIRYIVILGLLVYGYVKYNQYAQEQKAHEQYLIAQSQAAKEEEERRLEEERRRLEEESIAAEEAAANPYADIPYWDEYLFPDSDRRYLEEDEVSYLEYETLRIAINELYARHGYVFKAEDLRSYFESKDWYVPVEGIENQNDTIMAQFNEYEKANVQLLAKYRDMKK